MKWSSITSRVQRWLVPSGTAILGFAGIALLWAGVLHNLSTEYQAALKGAVNTTANLSRAFEEQIIRSIKAVDQSLMFVRESYARNPEQFKVADWARSAEAVTDVAIQLTLVDRDGFVTANSITPTTSRLDLNDREHIRVQIDSTEDKLFISRPVIGRVSHKWSIQFTRKLFTADGKFDGVAVISLDPTYLTRFYGSIDLGQHGAVTLIGTDGIVRAAVRAGVDPNTDFAIGKSVPVAALTDTALPHKARASAVDLDQIRRITSFRHVQSYPLVVAVGVGEEETLSRFWAARRTYCVVGSLITGLLALATLLILLHQHRLAAARERLRESEAKYADKSALLETALEHMGQGIMMVDGNRRVRVCNQRAMLKLGLSPTLFEQELLLDDLIRLQWESGEFGPEGASVDVETRDFILAGGVSAERHIYERTRPNGQVLEVRSVPLEDGGVVRTYTDVTERRAAEEDLRAARDQADSATRAKSEFLATMSHEIRSPLSGLVGALDLLRETALDAEQAHMTKLAHGSAQALLAILNDILDFSKIEADALSLSIEPVELSSFMAQVAQPHALVAARRQVKLNVHIDPETPASVQMDKMRIGQVVNNLLSNSVKFTEHGQIDLKLRCEGAGNVRKLVFEVSDTGCGMDAATIARLFQPFTQADGSSSRNAGGTGLGLSISRRLAEKMGGNLVVDSKPGQGSSFKLIMPCIPAKIVAAPRSLLEAVEASVPRPGIRILLVDDDETNQWLSKRNLLKLGAVVETASSGEEALATLRAIDYDLMLTDCHMPGMDGVALTLSVRRSGEPYRKIPIVGLTADVTTEQARRCNEAGMDEVVHKPLDRERFARLLLRHVPEPARLHPQAGSESFNPATYLDLFADVDPDGADWLTTFCDNARARVTTLRASMSPLDRAVLEAAAHQLVGASLSVGANRLAHLSRAFEQATLTEPAADLQERLAALEREADRALAAIAAFLQTLPAPV